MSLLRRIFNSTLFKAAPMESHPRPIHNAQQHQFEIESDGRGAVLVYKLSDGKLYLLHTETPPELQGRGLGSELAKSALDYARKNHLGVVPWCPFVKAYIDRHKEYRSLVVEG
jgi:predicted GNAT family acetyltransferase